MTRMFKCPYEELPPAHAHHTALHSRHNGDLSPGIPPYFYFFLETCPTHLSNFPCKHKLSNSFYTTTGYINAAHPTPSRPTNTLTWSSVPNCSQQMAQGSSLSLRFSLSACSKQCVRPMAQYQKGCMGGEEAWARREAWQ